jgi:cell division protein FtsL
MTPPPPITFAGKGPASGHTRQLRRKPAPAAPRRVAGPVRGQAARTTQPPTRRTERSAAPRRVSGPARRTATRRPPRTRPLGARALTYIRALPDHRLIDRLIHSRGWIPVLGVLLSGIVFMQVEVLKLNASMGRAIQQSSALQSRNELLRNTVSALSDDQRIETLAARDGMVMPAPDAPSFLSSRARVGAALGNIHAPDPTAFAASLPSLTNPTTSTVAPTTSSVTPTSTVLPGVPGGVTPSSTVPAGTVVPATSSTTTSGG